QTAAFPLTPSYAATLLWSRQYRIFILKDRQIIFTEHFVPCQSCFALRNQTDSLSQLPPSQIAP
ncbi:unnamed protein product, partial [Bubo scandiacus]